MKISKRHSIHKAVRRSSVALLIIGPLLVIGCGNSDEEGSATTTTPPATPESSTTTTEPVETSDSSTTTVVDDSEQPETAVWPFASGTTRYDEPVDAAEGFAIEYLGFVEPVVGDFMQGDTRSGEVAIQSRDEGPVTTVFVRQLGPDDTWWVLGASTPNIEIESPETLSTISSPAEVSGQSSAFEGTINLEIREDGRLDPMVEGFATGGANGEMGPFSTSLTLSEGGAEHGAIVAKTMSARDGSIVEATVIRVSFD